MDEEPRLPGGEKEELASGGAPAYWTYHLWLDDTCISIDNCPDCLRRENFDCGLCEFFSPEYCRLLNESYLLRETRVLFSICREQRAVHTERQRRIVDAAYAELQAHGRALHCTVLAAILADRHPELDVSEHQVATVMSAHPDRFERVTSGVYRCRTSERS